MKAQKLPQKTQMYFQQKRRCKINKTATFNYKSATSSVSVIQGIKTRSKQSKNTKAQSDIQRAECSRADQAQRRIQEGHGAMAPSNHQIFSKARFLMSFQIFLDSIIDLSNETITFILPCILCSFIRSLNSQ